MCELELDCKGSTCDMLTDGNVPNLRYKLFCKRKTLTLLTCGWDDSLGFWVFEFRVEGLGLRVKVEGSLTTAAVSMLTWCKQQW